MRYKNRVIYYAAVGASAAVLYLIPVSQITHMLVGGAAIFLPIALVVWVVNELIFGMALSRKNYEASIVSKIVAGLVILGAGIVVYGIAKNDALAAQIGIAVLLYAFETHITRQEENVMA